MVRPSSRRRETLRLAYINYINHSWVFNAYSEPLQLLDPVPSLTRYHKDLQGLSKLATLDYKTSSARFRVLTGIVFAQTDVVVDLSLCIGPETFSTNGASPFY